MNYIVYMILRSVRQYFFIVKITMTKKIVKRSSEPKNKIRPALTPEARENQLVSLAINLAEQQLRDGTASSQVITHYLKLGTQKEKLEREKLERENELLRAKTESIASAKRVEELYENALKAMRDYSGQSNIESEEEDDEYRY